MGNEKSILRGLEIGDKAIEVTDYWMHYDANVEDSGLQRLSIFISEPSLHFTAAFGRPSPLERAAKVYLSLFHSHLYISISFINFIVDCSLLYHMTYRCSLIIKSYRNFL